MMALFAGLLAGLFAASPALASEESAPPPQGSAESILSASVVVAVAKPDEVAEALIAKTEAAGGWFRSREPGAVSLAVPRSAYEEILALTEQQGLVLSKSISRTDASQELGELRSRLSSREALLGDYERVLATARSEAVLSVEYQMTSNISQIESLRGRIALLESQVSHAQLDVSFQFRDRAAPARTGGSSFAWITTLNVQDIATSVIVPSKPHETKGARVSAPEGLAGWKDKRSYRAIAPDQTIFRLRTARQKPAATLEFWKEAVRDRMEAAGYTTLGEGEISAGELPGAFIELAAPVGTEDWLYWVAFFPDGKRIIIAEGAGEVLRFAKHRDAIVAAVRAMEP